MSSSGSTRVTLIAVVLFAVAAVVFAGAAYWQHSIASSKADDAAAHDEAVSLFTQAKGEGQQAGELLQQYVATGDVSLIQQINDHTSSGVTLLTAAVQASDVDGQAMLDGGSALVQAEGQVIALRQAGDVQGAIAGLQQLQTQFEQFLSTQDGVIAAEQAAAVDAHNGGERADTRTTWMVIGLASFAICTLIAGAFHVRRAATRRRTLGAVPSA